MDVLTLVVGIAFVVMGGWFVLRDVDNRGGVRRVVTVGALFVARCSVPGAGRPSPGRGPVGGCCDHSVVRRAEARAAVGRDSGDPEGSRTADLGLGRGCRTTRGRRARRCGAAVLRGAHRVPALRALHAADAVRLGDLRVRGPRRLDRGRHRRDADRAPDQSDDGDGPVPGHGVAGQVAALSATGGPGQRDGRRHRLADGQRAGPRRRPGVEHPDHVSVVAGDRRAHGGSGCGRCSCVRVESQGRVVLLARSRGRHRPRAALGGRRRRSAGGVGPHRGDGTAVPDESHRHPAGRRRSVRPHRYRTVGTCRPRPAARRCGSGRHRGGSDRRRGRLLNSAAIVRDSLDVDNARRTVERWLGPDSQFTLVSLDVEGPAVAIVLAGPGSLRRRNGWPRCCSTSTTRSASTCSGSLARGCRCARQHGCPTHDSRRRFWCSRPATTIRGLDVRAAVASM